MAKQFSPKQLEAQKKFAELMKQKAGTGKNPKKPAAEGTASAAAAKSNGVTDEQLLIGAVVIIALGVAAWYFFFREKKEKAQPANSDNMGQPE